MPAVTLPDVAVGRSRATALGAGEEEPARVVLRADRRRFRPPARPRARERPWRRAKKGDTDVFEAGDGEGWGKKVILPLRPAE